MSLTSAEVASKINDLEDFELDWSEWETKFILNLKKELERLDEENEEKEENEKDSEIELTPRQEKSLEDMITKYCEG